MCERSERDFAREAVVLTRPAPSSTRSLHDLPLVRSRQAGPHTHTGSFYAVSGELVNLGMKEALAPKGEGFRFGRTQEASNIARCRAPIDGTDLFLQCIDQPFAVVGHVELLLPRAGLPQRGGKEGQVQGNVICDVPGKVEPVAALEIGTAEQGMNLEREIGRQILVPHLVIGREVEEGSGFGLLPVWWTPR